MRDFSRPGRSTVFATNGMCATSHPLASKVAIQMLEAGGNAVDAAIAGAVLLGICEPQMTGIGGDCFVLMTPPGGDEVIALNGSGRAPAGLDAAALRAAGHTKISADNPHSVTMPGAVDAFCRLAKDHGKLGLKAALAPAVYYAEAGVPVAPRVADDWARDASILQGRAKDLFLLNGAVPRPGDVFRAPKQAEVLRLIATEGRDGFYDGPVADDMVKTLQAFGGTHQLQDFADVACEYTTPVHGSYGDLEIYEHPPNGQGATALLLLNILKHFDLSSLDPFGPERAHLETEATKLAYAWRNAAVADPDHVSRLDEMLSDETAAACAAQIQMDAVLPVNPPVAENTHKDTITITVVDKDRMCVSLIYSIFNGFGSGIATDQFGILLHNRGSGFTLTEGHANEAGPGKRPMHTIIPGLAMKNGKPFMPFGVMGGQYQATGHARLITNMVDYGLDPQSAIDAPRCFIENGELRVETAYPPDVRHALSELGHDVVDPPTPIGGAQAIVVHSNGVLEGASDPRKDGIALGY
ncbi:MAG: gamma-glutamyltransferase family protein [Pseudomonadota bacterium]